MTRYIGKRLLLMIPTLLGAAVFVFLLMRLIPGDVCELRLAGEGAYADERAIQLCREQAGLTKSLPRQFLDWIWGMVRGDFGVSMWTRAADHLRNRFAFSTLAASGHHGHDDGHSPGNSTRNPIGH